MIHISLQIRIKIFSFHHKFNTVQAIFHQKIRIILSVDLMQFQLKGKVYFGSNTKIGDYIDQST